MFALPIDAVLPNLMQQLEHNRSAVLVARPGAGKTTRVPLKLLEAGWLADQRIIMLEPRRLAARSAARYMAASLGEEVGETVGYRVKQDTKVGPGTRIEVVTEGVLTRMLQSDPTLEGVGLVIFDEYHERSLHADLGLALCLQCRALFQDELRIVVMSATLDALPVSRLLGDDVAIVECEGRTYPVETRYAAKKQDDSIEEMTARAVMRALSEETGDALVFLPGAGEIRRVEGLLAGRIADASMQVMPLHGSLPQAEQDRAVMPSPAGKRKVVLATSIAETSLTIEGVRIVVDSGWMRVSRFAPQTGMSRLETVRVSLSSAEQRRGRAGRVAPGVCYRLWTEQEETVFAAYGTAEILQADLAPLALDLAEWGTPDPAQLAWLDAPPQGAYKQARELLAMLGALDDAGAITAHGHRLAELGMHPRLGHLVIRSLEYGLGETACYLAGLLQERDIFRYGAGGAGRSSGGERLAPASWPASADLRLRLEALAAWRGAGGARVDESAARRVEAEAVGWMRALGIRRERRIDSEACGQLLALAFPDRIGQSRGGGRYLLSGGRGAALPGPQPISGAPYLIAAELDDVGPESRILLAAPVDAEALERVCASSIVEEEAVEWERDAQAVRARKKRRLGALILSEVPLMKPSAERTAQALVDGIRQEGDAILPWTAASARLRQRVQLMSRYASDWPDWSDEAWGGALERLLLPFIGGMKSRSDLQRLNLVAVLEAGLTWEQKQRLEQEAPTHMAVPSGSRIAIDYSDPQAPTLSVRLQELFGMTQTPLIAYGQVPLTIHLLSPAMRPVQITRDLASFWRDTYFEVKKDLKGRYPKHHWPDDPLAAKPTSRVKKPVK